jgi:ADP-ribose pyrophosphatase YjhB (NUDIX family)
MPMSDYMRAVRNKVGTDLLEMPSVSILTFDAAQRVLLVRHVEGNVWTNPGGMIEPLETPADAAMREMWEETGLHVELTHIIGVFGGPLCSITYGNGDRVAWVSTVFGARVLGGELRPDGDETLETRYVDRAELPTLPRKPHVDMFLDAAWRQQAGAAFQPARWKPPGA